MTTDWRATTNPKRPGAAGRRAPPAAGAGDEAAYAKHAATRARKARDLTAVVTSWNRLLRRRPAHCRRRKRTRTVTAIGLMAGSSDGTSTAENSPSAIVR